MATLQTVIDEIQVIADAMEGLNEFRFERLEKVNAHKEQKFPLLVVEDSPDFEFFRLSSGKTRWHLKFHFFDTYVIGEKTINSLQAKYAQLKLMAWQFMKELETRSDDDPDLGFNIQSPDGELRGFVAYDVFNNKLAQVTLEVNINALGDCEVGTFEYD